MTIINFMNAKLWYQVKACSPILSFKCSKDEVDTPKCEVGVYALVSGMSRRSVLDSTEERVGNPPVQTPHLK